MPNHFINEYNSQFTSVKPKDVTIILYNNTNIKNENELILTAFKLYQELCGNINAIEYILKVNNKIEKESYLNLESRALLIFIETVLSVCHERFRFNIDNTEFLGFNIRISLEDYSLNRNIPGLSIGVIKKDNNKHSANYITVARLINTP